jgi:hypothetical protein
VGRVTEFIHFINIDRKKLHIGRNMKDEDYKFITIRMKTKRARYEHQTELKKERKK